ncbi:PREDICTED: disease resistance-like protein CSA1 [Tarenaya hassleriana]|uniref:disease resistance-like protein CSA1 n=1 Tax=Tarenaya hassleriana TaxID=28532 RepID=UPI0008FD24AD|nr:PREDICTED: disease resistance-like protein CSA1 [Tarenaya hassleriana]
MDYLCISGCESRDHVPLSFPPLLRVCSLTRLEMMGLHILHIPAEIGCLTSLIFLNLSRNDFKILPDSIKHLSKLQFLGLSYCRKLESLFEDISCLISLRILDLRGNDFKVLPASIKHLPKLEEFHISYCRRLESLSGLPSSLWHFVAHDCSSLGTISSDMKFVHQIVGGKYIFSNCLKQKEDMSVKVQTAAKSLFQTASPYFLNGVVMCLPGRNIPDWFTGRGTGASVTLQLPTGLRDNNSIGLALCISVAFTDYSPKLGLTIHGDFRLESREDYFHEKEAWDFDLKPFERESMQAPADVQTRFLRSDHIFLCSRNLYVEECNNHKTVTVTFHLLDGADMPLECCRVEKCAYYVLPS